MCVVPPEQVAGFVAALRLARIHGIGPVTAARLEKHGLTTCSDVTAQPREEIVATFGPHFGTWLYERAQGLDDREIETSRIRKSFGQESTFARDLLTLDQMIGALRGLGTEVAETLREGGRKGRTITLKVRYADFTSVTRAATLAFPTQSPDLITDTAIRLLKLTRAPGSVT